MTAPRPIAVPRFGAQLRTCREERGLGASQVVRILKERFGLTIEQPGLWRYEAGQITSPDPAILWALSRIYRVNFDELIGSLAKERAKHPIAQSDLAAQNITDRSAGLSEETMALAHVIERLSPAVRSVISIQAAMLSKLDRGLRLRNMDDRDANDQDQESAANGQIR